MNRFKPVSENQSEMPVIREVIAELKKCNNITGRTVQVADKRLNCAKNILDARKRRLLSIYTANVLKLTLQENSPCKNKRTGNVFNAKNVRKLKRCNLKEIV